MEQFVKLVDYGDDGKIKFYTNILESVIKDGDCLHLPTLVVSVSGDSHSGKSLLMSCLSTFAQFYSECGITIDWPTCRSDLKNSHWSTGEHTRGLWIYSRAIPINIRDVKVAVLLVDCQGCGNSSNQQLDMFTMYLTSCLTNVQLYNVMSEVSSDHMQQLELMADIANACGTDCAVESLVCVVRDWSKDQVYGEKAHLLEKKRESAESIGDETQCRSITNRTCFTLPNPGKKLLQASSDSTNNTRADKAEHITAASPESQQSTVSLRKVEGDNPSVQDMDNEFREAISKLFMSVVENVHSVQSLGTGSNVVKGFVALEKRLVRAAGDKKLTASACEEVICSKIYADVRFMSEKKIEQWYTKNDERHVVENWDKEVNTIVSTSRDLVSRNRAMARYGDTDISRKHSQAFDKRWKELKGRGQLFKCGMQLKELCTEMKTVKCPEEQKTIEARIAELYRHLQEKINYIISTADTKGQSDCSLQAETQAELPAGNHLEWVEGLVQVFNRAVGADNSFAPVTEPFRKLFWNFSDGQKHDVKDLDLNDFKMLRDGRDEVAFSDHKSDLPKGSDITDNRNLEIASHNATYEEVPEELMADIRRLCEKHNVGHAIFLQSPTNSQKVVVIGLNAESMRSELRSISQRFTVTSHNKTDQNSLYTKQFAAITKKTAVNGKWQTSCTGTCELVVVAEERNKERPSRSGALYAVAPGHLVLTDDLCQKAALADCERSQIREQMEGKTTLNRYVILMGRSVLDLPHPPLLGYRHWYTESKGAKKETAAASSAHESFMNDMALLQLPNHNPPPSLIGKRLLPLHTREHLEGLARRRQRVFVHKFEGHLTPCPKSVHADRQYGLHLAFVLTSGSLDPGHSGSIVHFKDKDDQLLPVAMLIGMFAENVFDVQIYQAVVLSQALKDIETNYPHHVADIRQLDLQKIENEYPHRVSDIHLLAPHH